MEPPKKRRSANFSKYEINILLELVEKYHSIVENRRTDGVSVQQKNAAWAEIEKEFYKAPGVTKREEGKLKTAYENSKRKAVQKKADARVETMRTGGGPCPQNIIGEIDERVLGILGPRASSEFNAFDSDAQFHGDTVSSHESIELELQFSDSEPPIAATGAAPVLVPVAGPSSAIDELGSVLIGGGGSSASASASASASGSGSASALVATPKPWHRRRLPTYQPKTSPIDSACNKRVEYLDSDLKMREKEHYKFMEVKELEKQHFQLQIKVSAEQLRYWERMNNKLDKN